MIWRYGLATLIIVAVSISAIFAATHVAGPLDLPIWMSVAFRGAPLLIGGITVAIAWETIVGSRTHEDLSH